MKYVCDLLSIKYPIIQGGMGNISNAVLTAAVSEAGGLGTIGCGTMTPIEVEGKIIETKKRTNKPFAINIAITVTPFLSELIDLVIKYNIPVVSLSAGNPAPLVPLLHQHGIKVIAVVASVKHAQKAEAASADLVVAEGFEAAGINSNLELTTMTLIPQITQSVKIPVVAAGGIGNGQGLAAALLLGASGIQMGTRFIATQEAPFHHNYKQNLVDASDTETVIVGRSVGRVRRLLKTPYAKVLLKHEDNGITLDEFNQMTSEKQHITGAIAGDLENGFINSGQITGMISSIPTVKALIEGIMNEAESHINRAAYQFEKITS